MIEREERERDRERESNGNDWCFRPDSALVRLYFAGDNLDYWDEFYYKPVAGSWLDLFFTRILPAYEDLQKKVLSSFHLYLVNKQNVTIPKIL